MHEVNLWMPFWTAARRMDMMPPEIPAKAQCLVNGQISEVLVAEYEHFALRGEQGKLITSCGREATELDATDRGANGRSQIISLCAGG